MISFELVSVEMNLRLDGQIVALAVAAGRATRLQLRELSVFNLMHELAQPRPEQELVVSRRRMMLSRMVTVFLVRPRLVVVVEQGVD